MVYRGHVKNGVVVLDDPQALPEGAEVNVEPIEDSQIQEPPTGEPTEGVRTLYDRLKPLIGAIKDSPPDLSRNLDHYLYGLPKRK